jgi:hypothetical protein
VTTVGYNSNVNAGGGGGGFSSAGGPGTTTAVLGVNSTRPTTPIAGGIAFSLLPVPVPASSLDHFLVGGSGGGGGGSHPYLALSFANPQFVNDRWKAGGGGTGGGGILAVRAGGQVAVSGALRSRGGAGAIYNADNPLTAPNPDLAHTTLSFGLPAPGGGGSGGTLLVQSARDVVGPGSLDTSGGAGSRLANMLPASPLTSSVVCDSRGGDGSPGFVRIEAGGVSSLTGPSIPAASTASLLDRDLQSGSRSLWLAPGTFELPTYRRYELRLDIGGTLVTLSDDPAVGPPADAGSPVARLRFQAARLLPNGQVDPTSIGPWRDYAGSQQAGFGIGHDRGDVFRFDLVLDNTSGVRPRGAEVVVVYR